MRLDKLSEVAKVNTDAMRVAQDEISEYRRQLQSKTTELEALKGTQESLERQRQDSEERHHADVLSYQVAWRSGQSPKSVTWCRGSIQLSGKSSAGAVASGMLMSAASTFELSPAPDVQTARAKAASRLLCLAPAMELSLVSAAHDIDHKCH